MGRFLPLPGRVGIQKYSEALAVGSKINLDEARAEDLHRRPLPGFACCKRITGDVVFRNHLSGGL